MIIPRKCVSNYSLDVFSKAQNWSTPGLGGGPFDIVTVTCSKDLPALRLQARSLAKYLDRDFRGSIVLIVNDLRPHRLIGKIRETVLDDYGVWRPRVVILAFRELGRGLDPIDGWKMQQALKLAASSVVHKPFYVVLDSKNHFIRHARIADFVTQQGFARQSLEADKPTLDVHAAASARLLGLRPEDVQPCWPMTPFVMHTRTTRNLVERLEHQEGRSIFAIFKAVRFLSEFLLYKAFLEIAASEGNPAPYEPGPLLSRTVWPGQDVGAAIADAKSNTDTLVFGVHRDVLRKSGEEDVALIEHFWRDAGITEVVPVGAPAPGSASQASALAKALRRSKRQKSCSLAARDVRGDACSEPLRQ